jgi:hypothetical protein
MTEEMSTKQTIFILSSMLAFVILCVFLYPIVVPPSPGLQPNPERAREFGRQQGEETVRSTEAFLADVIQTEGRPLWIVPTNTHLTMCATKLYDVLQRNNEQYGITITANANDTAYPFRDVPDIRLDIIFPDTTVVHLWRYAGGLNTCEFE